MALVPVLDLTTYRMSNPLQNHHFGRQNDAPMNFSILTPLPPVPRYHFLGGRVRGSWRSKLGWPLAATVR